MTLVERLIYEDLILTRSDGEAGGSVTGGAEIGTPDADEWTDLVTDGWVVPENEPVIRAPEWPVLYDQDSDQDLVFGDQEPAHERDSVFEDRWSTGRDEAAPDGPNGSKDRRGRVLDADDQNADTCDDEPGSTTHDPAPPDTSDSEAMKNSTAPVAQSGLGIGATEGGRAGEQSAGGELALGRLDPPGPVLSGAAVQTGPGAAEASFLLTSYLQRAGTRPVLASWGTTHTQRPLLVSAGELTELGVPVEVAADCARREDLIDLLGGLVSGLDFVPPRGVSVVVGPLDWAWNVADGLFDRVMVLDRVGPKTFKALTEAMVRQLNRHGSAAVVAAAGSLPADEDAIRRLIRTVRPVEIRVVADAAWTEQRIWRTAQLPGRSVMDVVNTKATGRPCTAMRVGIPVVSVDGYPADARTWARIILGKLGKD